VEDGFAGKQQQQQQQHWQRAVGLKSGDLSESEVEGRSSVERLARKRRQD
jgi:hypothetical protein